MKEQHGRAQALYQLWTAQHTEVVNTVRASRILPAILTLHGHGVREVRWPTADARLFVSCAPYFPLMGPGVGASRLLPPVNVEDQRVLYTVEVTEEEEPAVDGRDRVLVVAHHPLRPYPDDLEVFIYRRNHYQGWLGAVVAEAAAYAVFGPVPETATDEEKAAVFWQAEMRLKQRIARIDN